VAAVFRRRRRPSRRGRPQMPAAGLLVSGGSRGRRLRTGRDGAHALGPAPGRGTVVSTASRRPEPAEARQPDTGHPARRGLQLFAGREPSSPTCCGVPIAVGAADLTRSIDIQQDQRPARRGFLDERGAEPPDPGAACACHRVRGAR
jgi:hypothetical protein